MEEGPIAILTPFGWTVMGPIEAVISSSSVNSIPLDWSINSKQEPYPKLENVFETRAERRDFKFEQESAAMSILQSTTRLLSNGHYESGLLWKSLPPNLPDNRLGALKLLYANETRCKQDEKYCSELVAGCCHRKASELGLLKKA